jgi:hypothetical protein
LRQILRDLLFDIEENWLSLAESYRAAWRVVHATFDQFHQEIADAPTN